MESSFQLMIAYDMIYYVKFTALSIKTICRALSLLVLKILAVYLFISVTLFGVTPRLRRHPKKCEASPQRMRGVTLKMEGWPLTSFSKITIFQKQTS